MLNNASRRRKTYPFIRPQHYDAPLTINTGSYGFVASGTTNLFQRSTLSFSSLFSITDDTVNKMTVVTLPTLVSSSTYSVVTVDAYGRVTSGSTHSASPGTYTSVVVDSFGRVKSGTSGSLSTGSSGTYSVVSTNSQGLVTSGSSLTTTPGTYTSVVVDSFGRVKSGTSGSLSTGSSGTYSVVTTNDQGLVTSGSTNSISPGSYSLVTVDQYGRVTGGASGSISSESVLSAGFNLTGADGVFQDTGLSVTLPSAGTYLVEADVRGDLLITAGGAYIRAYFYNSTDASIVSDSHTICTYAGTINQYFFATTKITKLITVSSSKTIKLYASRNGVATYSLSNISSDANGYTRMHYVKIGL
jgi:hypothetical protein